jgi:hypothetical protein
MDTYSLRIKIESWGRATGIYWNCVWLHRTSCNVLRIPDPLRSPKRIPILVGDVSRSNSTTHTPLSARHWMAWHANVRIVVDLNHQQRAHQSRRQLADVRLLMKRYIWIPKRFCQSRPNQTDELIRTPVFFAGLRFPLPPLLGALPVAPATILSSFCLPNLFSNQVSSVSTISFALKSGSKVCWSFADLEAAEPDIVLPMVVGFVGSRILHVLECEEHASLQICRSCVFILKERWTCLH